MSMTDTQLATYLAGFSNVVTGDVKREAFVVYLRKDSTDDWHPLGYKQESAAISNNYEEENIKDVLGNVYNDITSKAEEIDMSEYKIHSTHSPFLDDIWKATLAGLENTLNSYQLLMVCSWLQNSSDAMLARMVENVSVNLDNMGGQGYTTADLKISGISRGVFGTVSSLTSPAFVEGTVSQ